MSLTMRQRSQLVQAAERGLRKEQCYKHCRIVFIGAVIALILLGVFL